MCQTQSARNKGGGKEAEYGERISQHCRNISSRFLFSRRVIALNKQKNKPQSHFVFLSKQKETCSQAIFL